MLTSAIRLMVELPGGSSYPKPALCVYHRRQPGVVIKTPEPFSCSCLTMDIQRLGWLPMAHERDEVGRHFRVKTLRLAAEGCVKEIEQA